MIDIESVVFAKVSAELRAKFSNIFVTGEYVKAPTKFPCVMLIQNDNPIYEPSRDLLNAENAVVPIITASIFSNKQTGKKTQAKVIAAVIADTMNGLGFTRTFDQPIPNADDATIYRIEQRYRRIVGGGDNI